MHEPGTPPSMLRRIKSFLRRAALQSDTPLQQYAIRYIRVRGYTRGFGRPPDLRPPRRFTEFLIHRLIYDRDPLLKEMSDKLAVRRIIADAVGDPYVVPVLGTWERARDIRWSELPLPAVLKPTHASGPFRFLHELGSVDLDALCREADGWLKDDYFFRSCEWSYRGCPRRLIAEPLLMAPDGGPLVESSVFTFHGQPVLIKSLVGLKGSPERCCIWQHATGEIADLTDITPLAIDRLPAEDFRRMKRQIDGARAEIVDVAARIGARTPLIRVDFYLTDRGLRIGELTAYPLAGSAAYEPPAWDVRLGRMLRDTGLERLKRGLAPFPWPPLD